MVCNRSTLFSVLLVACLCGIRLTQAQELYHWTGDLNQGGGDGYFAIPSHWSGGGGPPGVDDVAFFDYTGSYTVHTNGQQVWYTEVNGCTATFDGPYTTGKLVVGRNFPATLQLTPGSVLTMNEPFANEASLFIGPYTFGNLVADTAGSKVVVTGADVSVGMEGQGYLTLKNGGMAEFTGADHLRSACHFGEKAFSAGSVLVEGVGSKLTINLGGLEFGRAGSGRFDVLSQGEVQAANRNGFSALLLGSVGGGNGIGVVSGGNSTLRVLTGVVEIGRAGGGRLDVLNQGLMRIEGDQILSLTVGDQAGGSGVLVVDGADSKLAVLHGRVDMGNSGKGHAYVTHSGLVVVSTSDNVDGLLTVGRNALSEGSLNVSGLDSAVAVFGKVVIGGGGNGAVNLSNGGAVYLTGPVGQPALVLGDLASGYGALNIGTGSKAVVRLGNTVIGNSGSGIVRLTGGTLRAEGIFLLGTPSFTVGGLAGGNGTVEVTGPGAKLDCILTELVVGGGGKGTVSVSNHALLFSANAKVGDGGEGTIYITDNAAWQLDVGDLVVGNTSKGTLVVNNGKVFADAVTLAKEATSTGIIDLYNIDSQLNTPKLTFGEGNGSLILRADHELTLEQPLKLGGAAGTLQSIYVDGAAARCYVTADVTLGGAAGRGTGQLLVRGADAHFVIGNLKTGTGTGNVTADGGGSLVAKNVQLKQGYLSISGQNSEMFGERLELDGGSVTVRNGAYFGMSHSVRVAAGATIEVDATGRMAIRGASPVPGAIVVGAGASLYSAGTIKAKIINDGGTVRVGNSPGILAVQGDYEQTAAATMHCTIAGTTSGTEYSKLTANAVTLDGKLIIEFQHGFAPSNGQTFNLIEATTSITLAPSLQIELRNLAPGFQYSLAVVGTTYRLTALSNAVAAPVYSCVLDHVPGLFLRVEYTGILQSSTNLIDWTDVTGVPGTSHTIPEEELGDRKFFRVRAFS